MNTEREQNNDITSIIDIRLLELERVLDSYDPKSLFLRDLLIGAVIIAINLIALEIIMSFGVFWGIILLVLALVPFVYLLPDSDKHDGAPNKRDLSESACGIMSACVILKTAQIEKRKIYPYCLVLDYSMDGNLKLYKKFVALFPHMKSWKLKRLAAFKIGYR